MSSTSPGVSLMLVVPRRSSPEMLRPQQLMVLSISTAQAWVLPTDSDVVAVSAATGAGASGPTTIALTAATSAAASQYEFDRVLRDCAIR